MIEHELKKIYDELYFQNILKITELKLKYSEENFNETLKETVFLFPKKKR